MQYQGGKWKLRKDISNILKQLYEYDLEKDNKLKGYIEPFVGGGAVLVESMNWFPNNWELNASDFNEDLIILWKELQNGWEPPEYVDDDLYEKMKKQDDNGYKSALKTFVLLCSFGSKWRGGLARDKTGKRNYAKERKNRLLKDIKAIDNKVNFYYCSYENWLNYSNYLIYCDPPYRETLSYKGAKGSFDHDKFYDDVRELSKNNVVLVSEFDMPDDFKVLFEKEQNKSFKNKQGNCDRMKEKLFIHSNSINLI